MIRLPPISTLFPYTTLFRSISIFGLEFFYSKEKIIEIFSGIDARIKTILGYHLYFDFIFMAGVYPDRKSTRLNSSHGYISYAVFCLKKKKKKKKRLCIANNI